ncbi:hypothetical protein B0A49_02876 [Cryomyces minteri]|uniref:Succinyl-CoA:3-ketoacid coenzyme A transferase 1, mitochondrial n=1 Tax=Cryomyces minteri TaxID=331657 RepID=A0A4U0XBK2_9PEZI|nr:hypothetical protein B0A49_02876 [Cryomyces minteri]
MIRRNRIARRTSKELKHGYYVNLGVGIPTLAPSFLSPETRVWIQSENGILGMGAYPTEDEVDPDIVNAGKETVTLIPGASTFDSSESFGMIRGGHIDVSILGALQVSGNGDLANYMIPGKVFKGMGGAMDLTSNPDSTKIVVATEHVAKDGSSKIVDTCSLPLTGARVVSTIITDLVDRVKGGLELTELAPGIDVEEVRRKTNAAFRVAGTVLFRIKVGLAVENEDIEEALSSKFDYSWVDWNFVNKINCLKGVPTQEKTSEDRYFLCKGCATSLFGGNFKKHHFKIENGSQGVLNHMRDAHGLGKDGKPLASTNKKRKIRLDGQVEELSLDPNSPRDQKIINRLAAAFDEAYFQRLLIR